jgi:signal peptidase II
MRWLASSERLRLLLVLLLVMISLDQGTKVLAQQYLMGEPPIIYWGDLFRFEYAENSGAFLSLGAGLPDSVRFLLLTVVVGVILLGACYMLLTDPKISKLSIWALSLMVSGGASNLLDRMFRAEGRVVDFMNMGVGPLRTGIFNIADVAIMAGLFLFLFEIVKDSGRRA